MEIETENGPPKLFHDIRGIGQNEEVSVKQEVESLHQTFKGLRQNYKVLDKIGEGTFSTVYKAVDLKYNSYPSGWDQEQSYQTENKTNHLVALKRIYVTSSPSRIANELQLLYKLRNCKHVSTLITALRDKDQILVVLPYFEHTGFHLIYRYSDVSECRNYMRELFLALESVHSKGIIHRDVKPNNFLYNWATGRGILVDFGLAERESDSTACACKTDGVGGVIPYKSQGGYRKEDRRSSRRANRAGTRGYRAPEVLFRCLSQTGKIDIWSAGVMLLTILTHRSPLFNSLDDPDAMIEIATIFGKSKLQACALLHGTVFETNIPMPNHAMPLSEFVRKFRSNRNKGDENVELSEEEFLALDLAKRCLEVDFRKRYSAKQALTHEFFRTNGSSEFNVEMQTARELDEDRRNGFDDAEDGEIDQQLDDEDDDDDDDEAVVEGQFEPNQIDVEDEEKDGSRDEGVDTEKLDTFSGDNAGTNDENYDTNEKDDQAQPNYDEFINALSDNE
jgi:cell division control protein 7